MAMKVENRANSPWRCRPDPQRGFTLIEVCIALVVLSIGILGWQAFQGRLVVNRASSRDYSRAFEVSRALLEELAGSSADWGYDSDSRQVVEGDGWHVVQWANGNDWSDPTNQCLITGDDNVTVGTYTFHRSWQVTGRGYQNPGDNSNIFWKVQVRTTWTTDGQKSVSLERLVRGLN